MNTTINEVEGLIYREGDIFKDMEGDLYILGTIDNMDNWIAMCLNDGRSWSGMQDTASKATDRLTFVGRDLAIKVVNLN